MTDPMVAVVGSANLDIVVSLQRFPDVGETVVGDHLEEVAGGKGLNQAVAAAGDSVCALVGCVGDDDAGRLLIRQLERARVDTSQVVRQPEPTGRAYIEVTPDGENRIVVMALANRRLGANAVRRALDALNPVVVLAQLEVPLEAVKAASEWAASHAARFILNASPVVALPASLLAQSDPLIVNRVEAASLLAAASGDFEGETSPDAPIHDVAQRLAGRVRSVAVTDGPRGVHVGTAQHVTHVPGRRVTAVDTTGAGDVFAGTLASALAARLNLEEAGELASRAAARIVQLPRTER